MVDGAAEALMQWYDAHARRLPWRVGPAERQAGQRPDPYRVWLSEIMLQQTTVAAVKAYYERFTTLWPTVADLAAAEDGQVMGEWAGLGYYARARNLLKCARVVVAEHGGRFPETREALLGLPGIGPYTAAAVASIAFDRPETVVDGNVERVMARLFAVQAPLPAAKPELTALAASLTPVRRPGDHAQAVMDLGATICAPRNPACGICPLRDFCRARTEGLAADLPRKLPRKTKPTRHGVVWLARRADGAWLLERRPDRGLLGGMLGWPGTEWCEGPPAAPDAAPGPGPVEANWHDPGLKVRHTFTHFHLVLHMRIAQVGGNAVPRVGSFRDPAGFRRSDLPTVMRKALDLASTALGPIEPASASDL